MDKLISLKDVMRFIFKFGLPGLCIAVGLIVMVANKWLGIPWPCYVIVGSVSLSFGLILFIVQTIKEIIIYRKEKKDENIYSKK
uniref:Protein ORF5 n=1 Tax=Spiroplasma virus 4 TaxID=2928746 RepID=C_SPV4|nr:RecName: Full=Protein ORF5 [Spiroplasma phage 4]